MTMLYQTKYFGPTDVKGARIQVKRRKSLDKIKTTYHDYDHSAHDAHRVAVDEAMIDDLGLGDFQRASWNESDTLDRSGLIRIVWLQN